MTPPLIIQDFTKICRCCMEIAAYDIFKTYFENEPLAKILTICTSMRVPKNDTLPKNICQACLQQLVSSYIFNQKVMKTQTAILEIAKVLDKAKVKKNVVNDHDYHNEKKHRAAQQAKKAIAAVKAKADTNFSVEAAEEEEDEHLTTPIATQIKVEIDKDQEQDYIESNMEAIFGEEGQNPDMKVTIKKQMDDEQEYWFEDANEQEETNEDLDQYNAINNVFENVKLVNEEGQVLEGEVYEEEMDDDKFMEPNEEYEEGEIDGEPVFIKREKIVRKRNFRCVVCEQAFYTNKELNKHSEEDNHPQKFCSTCEEGFHTYSALLKHCMETKHARPQMYKCPYCFKKMEDKKLLAMHMRAHVKGKQQQPTARVGNFACQVCRSSFDTMVALRQHFTDNVETHMICSVCSKRFSSLSRLNAHIKIHEKDKPFECGTCGLRFSVEVNLLRHARTHVERQYSCNHCGKAFHQKTSLIQHVRNYHPNETSFLCTICGRTFMNQSQLRKHAERHATVLNPQQPHECELCGKILSCKATLYSHVKNVHERAQKVFPCVICGKVLKTKTSLELHVNYHTGNCPFKCDVCGKAFTNATTLKSHTLIHTDERPYSCHICSKTFKQKPHLNTHILTIHTGIKPYSCTYCDKTFALNGNLSQHLKTHTGCDSPFVCSICNKAFYFASRLRKHEKIHLNQGERD